MTSALILALLFAQQAVPPEKASISGTVVDSITGQPLGKVSVVARHATGHEPGASTVTDASGKFSIVDLDPGQYRLDLRRSGYLDTSFGAKRASDGAGSTISLTSGPKIEGLRAKITPMGVIAGTIRDSDGEPVAGAGVEVYNSRYEAGHRHIRPFDTVTTDDLGQYRMIDLPPGRYYISATLHRPDGTESTIDHSAKSDRSPEEPITTFYPGTSDPSGAGVVELAPGARATGIDVALVRSQVYKVTVHIDAQSGLRADASLRYAVDGFGPVGYSHSLNSRGDIEITSVPPGSYVMRFSAGTPGKPFDGVVDFNARPDGCGSEMPVSVKQGNVENLKAVVNGCAVIEGHVIREDGKALKHGGISADIGVDGTGPSMVIKPDNTFRGTMSAGSHSLDFSDVNEYNGLYLKSIRSGSQDFLRSGVTVSASEHIDLEVVLATDGGNVGGIVSDANGKPIPGASVVLIPNDAALRLRQDYTLNVTSDQSGHFEIKNAAPGEYKLFAWDDIEKDSWLDPDVLKDYETKGNPVTVKAKVPGEQTNPTQTINLTVIQ